VHDAPYSAQMDILELHSIGKYYKIMDAQHADNFVMPGDNIALVVVVKVYSGEVPLSHPNLNINSYIKTDRMQADMIVSQRLNFMEKTRNSSECEYSAAVFGLSQINDV
jgi:hypothetical protein